MARKKILYYAGMSATVLAAAFLWFSVFDIMQVKENSMYPQLCSGQTILVDKTAYKKFKVRPVKGDIIVFPSPWDGQLLVKRISLLPGEDIHISADGWLQMDKERVFLTPRQKENLEELSTVPGDCVLVLGDNVFHSIDSRDYGCIPIGTIHGKVLYPQRGCPR